MSLNECHIVQKNILMRSNHRIFWNCCLVKITECVYLNFGIFLFKLEEKMTLDGLNELNRAFMKADSDGSGTLELEEFKKVVKEALDIKGRVS